MAKRKEPTVDELHSVNPLFGKMDALFARHRGPASADLKDIPVLTEEAPHPHIPVLTEETHIEEFHDPVPVALDDDSILPDLPAHNHHAPVTQNSPASHLMFEPAEFAWLKPADARPVEHEVEEIVLVDVPRLPDAQPITAPPPAELVVLDLPTLDLGNIGFDTPEAMPAPEPKPVTEVKLQPIVPPKAEAPMQPVAAPPVQRPAAAPVQSLPSRPTAAPIRPQVPQPAPSITPQRPSAAPQASRPTAVPVNRPIVAPASKPTAEVRPTTGFNRPLAAPVNRSAPEPRPPLIPSRPVATVIETTTPAKPITPVSAETTIRAKTPAQPTAPVNQSGPEETISLTMATRIPDEYLIDLDQFDGLEEEIDAAILIATTPAEEITLFDESPADEEIVEITAATPAETPLPEDELLASAPAIEMAEIPAPVIPEESFEIEAQALDDEGVSEAVTAAPAQEQPDLNEPVEIASIPVHSTSITSDVHRAGGLDEHSIERITDLVSLHVTEEIGREVAEITQQHLNSALENLYAQSFMQLTEDISRDLQVHLALRVSQLVREELKRQGLI